MVNVLLRGPLWFFGIDAGFEFFYTVVLLAVFWLSFRAYKITKDTKYKYFSMAFSSLAVAFFSKAVTDLWLTIAFISKGVPPPSQIIGKIGEVFLAGYLIFIFLSLMAYVLLVTSTSRGREKRIMILTALLVLVPFYVSSSYSTLFYLLSILLYGFVATHFAENFFRRKSFTAGCVASAFSVITISQTMFLFDLFRNKLYIVGHLAQLTGFVLLFTALVKVLLNDRTKKQN